jgi:competence protein ComEC
VVVRTAQRTLVYDTGARVGASDMGARVIAPFLAGEGVARLDGLVVSHSDMDHAGGAASLWGRFAPGWLLAGEPERLSKERPPIAPQPCRAGQHWQWDGVRFDVLYPIHGGASDNHASCVLRVWAQGQALLLTGDAELADEDAMLAHWQPDCILIEGPPDGRRALQAHPYREPPLPQPPHHRCQGRLRARDGSPHRQHGLAGRGGRDRLRGRVILP